MTNALASFTGAKQAAATRALAGNVGGQAREQEAWTPTWVLDAARAAFGGPIQLDPCGASAWELPEVLDRRKDGSVVMTSHKTPRPKVKRAAVSGGWYADVTLTGEGGYQGPSPHGGVCMAVSGLSPNGVWGADTFFNPEFDNLAAWLDRAQASAARGYRVVGLFPYRARRGWWVAGTRGAELVQLYYDVRFQGYASAHPENMVLVGWNCSIPSLGKRETARWRW